MSFRFQFAFKTFHANNLFEDGALILPVTWYAYPETKGRSLEEMFVFFFLFQCYIPVTNFKLSSDEVFMNCGTGWQSVRNAVLVERQLPYVDHSKDAEKAGFGDPNALGHKFEVDHKEGAAPTAQHAEKPVVGDEESA